MNVDESLSGIPALSYAVAYPLGIVGIIVSMILVRVLFRVDVKEEVAQFEKSQRSGGQPIERSNLRVDNPNLDGLRIDAIPGLHETGVTVSRLKQRGESEVHVATGASVIHTGDVLLAVGTAPHLEAFQRIVGTQSDEDLMKAPGQVTFKRVIVTNKPVLGKTVRQLGFEAKYGVSVTRLQRGGVEMMVTSDVQLQFGDVLDYRRRCARTRSRCRRARKLAEAPQRNEFHPGLLRHCAGHHCGFASDRPSRVAGARAARSCGRPACPCHPACPCRQYRTARLVHAGQR